MIIFGVILIPTLPVILIFLYFIYFMSYRNVVTTQKEDKKNPIFVCGGVFYNGGDMRFVSNTGMISGAMGVGGKIIGFADHIVFISKKFSIKMPAKKIRFPEVTARIGTRGTQQQAMAYAGAGMSWGSLGAMAKDVFVKIPFIDDNGKKQEPEFELVNNKAAQILQSWIYEKTPKHAKGKAKTVKQKRVKDDDVMQTVKLRYAKGEITKKEFEVMKKDLA